jgi:hypothetical protein
MLQNAVTDDSRAIVEFESGILRSLTFSTGLPLVSFNRVTVSLKFNKICKSSMLYCLTFVTYRAQDRAIGQLKLRSACFPVW